MKLLATLAALSCLAAGQDLKGVFDIHAHADPDGMARSIDAIDLGKLAQSAGMRGLILKNHYEPTAGLAYLVRKEVPGLEAFGGIALNLPVGGINPAAVEWMTKVKGGYGRVVWMPTYDSEHHVTSQRESRPFVPISRDGKLLPQVVEVIGLIAKHKLVLATGHSSPEEVLLLIREAKRQGVEHIVVTHATNNFVGMNVSQMQEAASLGALLEFVRVRPGTPQVAETVQAIRAVGAASCILSSDLGQAGNAIHTVGLLAFFDDLKKQGLTQAEIDRMSKVNPAVLLGLKP
ncbi:MAG: hypothetical protein RL328_632 [Acidobacteriota bacterium]|jgi:hypothetical protein